MAGGRLIINLPGVACPAPPRPRRVAKSGADPKKADELCGALDGGEARPRAASGQAGLSGAAAQS